MFKIIISVVLCLFIGCAHQYEYSDYIPGFFSGMWHGSILPYSMVASIFSDVRIYNIPNSGRSYDFGFCIGLLFNSWPFAFLAGIFGWFTKN